MKQTQVEKLKLALQVAEAEERGENLEWEVAMTEGTHAGVWLGPRGAIARDYLSEAWIVRLKNCTGETNDGGPAFPVPGSLHQNGQVQYGGNGMSLRDWFAGKALSGLAASSYRAEGSTPGAAAITQAVTLSEHAFRLADAMLAARDKQREKSESINAELLEMLEMAVGNKTHPNGIEAWLNDANAAISKAKGQQ